MRDLASVQEALKFMEKVGEKVKSGGTDSLHKEAYVYSKIIRGQLSLRGKNQDQVNETASKNKCIVLAANLCVGQIRYFLGNVAPLHIPC